MKPGDRQPPPYTEQPMPGVHQQFVPPPPPPYEQFHPSAPLSQSYFPDYGTTPITATTTTVVVPPEIIIIGACPACRIGVLEDDFTCLGIFCAIFFFPIGILFCLLLKNKRCSNCGAYFG